jgi:2-polyprenyl-3-methyl-5-hydroxy-6-metoxy-1,4-benzoquinol methylase
MKELYASENSDYLKQNPTWHIEDSPWKATQILKMIERNQLKPATVAEIGCGAGEILNQLESRSQDKTVQFSGFEISPDAFQMAQERKKERLHFFKENLLESSQRFDLLLVIDVFEHVPDYMNFLSKCSNKATYKIYHVPLDMSVLSVLNKYPAVARKNVGHLHYFMKDTALAAISESGQGIIDWFYTKSAFEINKKGQGFSGSFINLFRRFFFWISPHFAVRMFGGFSLLVLTK